MITAVHDPQNVRNTTNDDILCAEKLIEGKICTLALMMPPSWVLIAEVVEGRPHAN